MEARFSNKTDQAQKLLLKHSDYICQLLKNLTAMPYLGRPEAMKRAAVAITIYYEVCEDLQGEYIEYLRQGHVGGATSAAVRSKAERNGDIVKSGINELSGAEKLEFLRYLFAKFNGVEQEAKVLFIERATVSGDRYSGQIGFPGGKTEKEDSSDWQTAVRETGEEIGLNINGPEFLHLGHLDDVVTSYSLFGAPPIMAISPQIFIKLGGRGQNLATGLRVNYEVNTVNFVGLDTILDYVIHPDYHIPPNPIERFASILAKKFSLNDQNQDSSNSAGRGKIDSNSNTRSTSSSFSDILQAQTGGNKKLSKIVLPPNKVLANLFGINSAKTKKKQKVTNRNLPDSEAIPGSSSNRNSVKELVGSRKPVFSFSNFLFGKYYYFCLPLEIMYRYPNTVDNKVHARNQNISMDSDSSSGEPRTPLNSASTFAPASSSLSPSSSRMPIQKPRVKPNGDPILGKFASNDNIFLWGLSLTMINNLVDYTVVYNKQLDLNPCAAYTGVAGHWPLLDQKRWFDVNYLILLAQRSHLFGRGGAPSTRKPLNPNSTRNSMDNYYPVLATALATSFATRSALVYYLLKASSVAIKSLLLVPDPSFNLTH